MAADEPTIPTTTPECLTNKKSIWDSLAKHRSCASASTRNNNPLYAAAVLLAIVSAAELLAAWFDPRLPPAALAMAFMLALFAIQGGPDTGTVRLYEATSAVLPILFVPAAVGAFQLGGFTIAVLVALALVVGGLTICLVALIGVLAQQLFREISQ